MLDFGCRLKLWDFERDAIVALAKSGTSEQGTAFSHIITLPQEAKRRHLEEHVEKYMHLKIKHL